VHNAKGVNQLTKTASGDSSETEQDLPF